MTAQPATAPALDSLFLDADRRIARATLALLLVPTLWFITTDLRLFEIDSPALAARFAIRALFVCTLVAGVWRLWLVRTPAAYERLVLVVSLVAAACVLSLNALRPQGAELPLRAPLLWLFAFYAGLPNARGRQLAPPLTLTAGIALLRIFWAGSPGVNDPGGDLLVLGVVNAVGAIFVHRRLAFRTALRETWAGRHAAQQSLAATTTELRVLRGLLPICSHCHRIRTDEGDWERLEEYVTARSQAEFTHGICPACLVEHYPEIHDPAPPEMAAGELTGLSRK